MTGAISADEVYGRIVQAVIGASLPLPENHESNAGVKVAKSALSTVIGFAAKKLEDVGLTYQLSPDACASLMLSRNSLVVLDDLERCPNLSLHSLYGLVSNLVESQGMKVLLVCNEQGSGYLEKSVEDNGARTELEKKLVWVRYPFEPDADWVVRSVMRPVFDGIPWSYDALSVIGRAFQQTGSNIRSLKKTRKLIEEVLNTEFMQDEGVDDSRKARVMGLITLLSLRFASGKPPVSEGHVQPGDYNALVLEGAIDPSEEKRASQLARLSFIKRFFEGVCEFELDDLDSTIRQFANSEFPESQIELDALRGEEQLRVGLLEDAEVISAVKAIMRALSSADVGVANIPRMLRVLLRAKEYGFLLDEDLGKAIGCCERILLDDPAASYAAIRSSYFEWSPDPIYATEEFSAVLCQLTDLASEANAEHWASDIEARVVDAGELSGRALVDAFSERSETVKMLPGFPVERFVDIVAKSNVESINALRGFFQSAFKGACVDANIRDDLHTWLGAVSNELGELQLPSKMRSLSVEYFVRDLESLRKKIYAQA